MSDLVAGAPGDARALPGREVPDTGVLGGGGAELPRGLDSSSSHLFSSWGREWRLQGVEHEGVLETLESFLG